MKPLKLITVGLIVVFLQGCTPTTMITTPRINYQQVSVPEEGGIQFIQYTSPDDNVQGPDVQFVESRLVWYAPALINLSNDGSKFAFLSEKNGNTNLYLKNTSGGKSTIQRTFRDNVLAMCFSPDDKKIVFTDATSNGNNNYSYNIYSINADQGAAMQQITSTGNTLGPVYAPSNDKIFFTKQENRKYYIWSFDLNSSLMTQYGEGFTPCLSKDGRSLYVTRNNKSTMLGEIWRIDLISGQETLLLSDNERGFSSPKLSPDETRIVCVGITPASKTRQTNLDIYTVNLDGTGLTQQTFHQGNDASPVWNTDGKSIYFLSQRGNEDGQWNVWKMAF